MGENYAHAALRHWGDALLLDREKRLENADQLYGLAAECAIKTVLHMLPAFSNGSCLLDEYKHHINVLWNKAGHQSIEKVSRTLSALLRARNPFYDWHVDRRSDRRFRRHRVAGPCSFAGCTERLAGRSPANQSGLASGTSCRTSAAANGGSLQHQGRRRPNDGLRDVGVVFGPLGQPSL